MITFQGVSLIIGCGVQLLPYTIGRRGVGLSRELMNYYGAESAANSCPSCMEESCGIFHYSMQKSNNVYKQNILMNTESVKFERHKSC